MVKSCTLGNGVQGDPPAGSSVLPAECLAWSVCHQAGQGLQQRTTGEWWGPRTRKKAEGLPRPSPLPSIHFPVLQEECCKWRTKGRKFCPSAVGWVPSPSAG